MIDGASVTVVDPNSGERMTLSEALNAGVVHAVTAHIIDFKTGKNVYYMMFTI